MSAHTLGPWSVMETVDGIDVVTQSETGSLVCEFPYGTDDSENGANARLIAAAPDGLAFARLAGEWARQVSERKDVPSSIRRAAVGIAKTANDFIAKATGDQP